jgi:hypothetical protein
MPVSSARRKPIREFVSDRLRAATRRGRRDSSTDRGGGKRRSAMRFEPYWHCQKPITVAPSDFDWRSAHGCKSRRTASYAVHEAGRSRTPCADFWCCCDPGARYRTRHLHRDGCKRFPVETSDIKSQKLHCGRHGTCSSPCITRQCSLSATARTLMFPGRGLGVPLDPREWLPALGRM